MNRISTDEELKLLGKKEQAENVSQLIKGEALNIGIELKLRK